MRTALMDYPWIDRATFMSAIGTVIEYLCMIPSGACIDRIIYLPHNVYSLYFLWVRPFRNLVVDDWVLSM